MTSNRTRGQKAGLTNEAILDGAVRLVDRDGLAKLSMRRLGAEVDVEAMTLYHYFANKDALLDGLVAHVFARATVSLADEGPWQARLAGYAHSLRATLLAHPGLVPLVVSRPAVTDATLRVMEHGLEVLHGAGFAPRAALDLVYTLNDFVIGHVAATVATAALTGRPGQEQRLNTVDAKRFPLLTEAAGAARPDTRFDAALDALFRGFAPQ